MKSHITVGTRGSKLALAQAELVINALNAIHTDLEFETKIIKTTADKILDKQLTKIGGKGLFIKEIEEALLNREIDFAVHSMKDVPHTIPDHFQIGAILKREDPRDVLICANARGLPAGSVVGTGSLRRSLQLKALRPDLLFKPVRGNIHTRVNKLADGQFDGLILAAAGIKRMGWQGKENSNFLNSFLNEAKDINLMINYFNINDFIPAVGQGALAIEIRNGDTEILDIIKVLNDEQDAKAVLAERAFLKEVDGGCEIPIGAYSTIGGDSLNIIGFIGDEKTGNLYRGNLTGKVDEYENLGVQLAKRVLELKKEGS